MTVTDENQETPRPPSLAAVLGFDDDQLEMRRSVRALLERHAPLSVASRTVRGRDSDRDLWRRLVAIGLPGVLVPASLGGSGLGLVEAAVVLEEAGRALLSAPLLSTMLSVAVILDSGDAARIGEILPRIAEGDLIPALACGENSAWPVGEPATVARYDDGWRLTGTKTMVLDGERADLLIVSAATEAGTALFTVDPLSSGVTRVPSPALDLTRPLAEIRLRNAHGEPVGALSRPAAVADALDLGVVLCAAEQVGAAQRCLEITVDYARNRSQYGRAIGSFQAVKHRCADMLIDVEYGRSLAYYAVWAAASGRGELPLLAGSLKSVVGDGFVDVAERMIQMHGGIGFTWEHVAHLFYKRALSDRLLFGLPEDLLDRSAGQLGL